jgi:carboxyl-terminal processing protease
VRTFSVDEAEMRAALEQIEAGGYRHLIIDLRENPGGSFPAVVALGRYLTREAIDTGVYLTRRWFVRRPNYPRPDELPSIAALEELDLDAFRQRLQEQGAVRLVLPAHDGPVFDGDVYVLTSRETASAAEPFVDLVRRRGGVTVIGETTAGAMLSGERFPVGDGWLLFAPVADYMTADGRRIDRVGVEPDIAVAADQALGMALDMIESR